MDNKKEKLRAMLKPLVKEILKECILEEGIVSTIIRESMGLANNANVVAERPSRKQPMDKRQKLQEAYQLHSLGEDEENDIEEYNYVESKKVAGEESRARLKEALRSKFSMDLLEGVEPVGEDSGASPYAGALSSEDPNDPGVDLGLITEIAGGRGGWKTILQRMGSIGNGD